MSKQLRFSRWRRLPGLHRVTDRKIPTHRAEPQRFTLYLPGELLDLAEDLARRAAAPTPQHYCEGLLVAALRLEAAQRDAQVGGIVASAMDSLDGFVHEESLDTDRDMILEPVPPTEPAPAASTSAPRFTFRVAPALSGPSRAAPLEPGAVRAAPPVPPVVPIAPPLPTAAELPGRTLVLRHAALAAPFDAASFLVQLRRGQAVGRAHALDLLDALESLGQALGGGQPLDRELAWALHRLAYEPQVLISEAWPALGHDSVTLQLVREVQNRVERIFEPGIGPPGRADSRRSP